MATRSISRVLLLVTVLTVKSWAMSIMPENTENTSLRPEEQGGFWIGQKFCPNATEIAPCSCTSHSFKFSPIFNMNTAFTSVWVTCRGPQITQSDVDRVLYLLKQETENDQDQGPDQNEKQLHASEYLFTLSWTDMTEFDLTSLVQTQLNMSVITFSNNKNLAKFVGPPTTSTADSDKINCVNLMVEGSPVTDEVVENLLINFSQDTLLFLDIYRTLVQGPARSLGESSTCPEKPVEFLSGLSNFKNLEVLMLGGNRIRELRCGPFALFEELRALDLHSNPIDLIGENGLLFSKNIRGHLEQDFGEHFLHAPKFYHGMGDFLDVHLGNTTLSEVKISKNWGLDNNEREIEVNLSANNFTTLPAAIFKPFLEKEGRSIVLFRNQLVCDDKLNWLAEVDDWMGNKSRNFSTAMSRMWGRKFKVTGVDLKCRHALAKIQENTTPQF